VAGLFWTLASGGELVIPTESEVHDPDALLGLFDSAAVSHTLMVPSLYGAMLERGRGQEGWPSVAVVAGEACPAALVARHEELRPGSALHNEYGPTEATVWTTAHRCRLDEDPTPIGGPIPGAWIAVVDGQGRPLPLGVRGELVVGGANVTGGYVSIVDESADEAGPFTVLPDAGPGPVYRTGDLAAICHDRSGERVALFLGRVDDQLNVGGMRVEPGEIEAAMLTVADVAVAAAVAVDRPRPQIIGWVERHSPEAERKATPRTDEPRPVDREVAAALEAAVARSIPTAARPARYLELDALPRTPHGKVDRASLAAIDVSSMANTVDGSPTAALTDASPAVHDPIVARVLEAFRNELQRPDFGPDDDFFVAGGDSLAALTLAVTLEEAFGQSVSVTALLQEPTARAVARQFDVERAEHGSAPSTDEVAVDPGGVPDRAAQPAGSAHAGSVSGTTTGAPIGLVEWIRPPREQDQSVLVLVAPGSGHLLGYRHLVDALPTDTALLGVRLPGHDGKRAPAITVRRQASAVEPAVEKALAEFSVERDRCLLFGGSSGGLLAWELEQRAEAAGRPFGTVMMQDTLHPQGRLEADQGEGLLGSLGAIKSIPLRIAARQVTSRARALRNDVLSRLEVARTRRAHVDPEEVAKRLFRAANDSSVTYRVAPIHCHVHFIGASQTDGRLTHRRWQDVAADFRLTIIEGEHHGERGITSAGKAGQVAEIVTAELERLSR
jgi:thioesterase domain-containing protein/acyl carrier protein